MFSEKIAIRIENISKCYHIYEKPQDRLKQLLLPNFLKKKSTLYKEFWALQDTSFEIKKGQCVGIVGRNGSGKSTLLQLITGVLQPTSGNIEINGRIAALLELGSGFNPEFTGRENVYMNAAIIGLSRAETDSKIEDILAFADIGAFIDQPIKTYSSGMLVRLAFAVQVQIQPEILIVDEALAVGDALFQKRCFRKMEQLQNDGTTVLIVSHDQESIRSMTSRAILLKNGRVCADGPSGEIILEYRRQLHNEEIAYFEQVTESLATKSAALLKTEAAITKPEGRSADMSFGTYDAEIVGVKILKFDNEAASLFYPDDLIRILIRFVVHRPVSRLNIGIRLRNKEGVKVFSGGSYNYDLAGWSADPSHAGVWDQILSPGSYITEINFLNTLGENLYEVQAYLCEERTRTIGDQRMIHWMDEAAFFHVAMDKYRKWYGGVCNLSVKVNLGSAKSEAGFEFEPIAALNQAATSNPLHALGERTSR